jgi:hypothetical protein
MGRFGTVENIANTALFLASDLSAYISRIVNPVDGGISAITQNTFDQEAKAVALVLWRLLRATHQGANDNALLEGFLDDEASHDRRSARSWGK